MAAVFYRSIFIYAAAFWYSVAASWGSIVYSAYLINAGPIVAISQNKYRLTSNKRDTKSQNVTDFRLALQLYLPNPLKPDIKRTMKM